jgi:hypothetical protein
MYSVFPVQQSHTQEQVSIGKQEMALIVSIALRPEIKLHHISQKTFHHHESYKKL